MTDPASQLKTLLELYKIGKDVKQKIIGFIDKKKYGFVPDAGEASSLQRIGESPVYCRLCECVGDHWSLNLVKVGIYIMELNDEGERKLIREIRTRVLKKHGPNGMKILNLGSTGVILDIIEYLDDLISRKGYGQEYIAQEFDRILENWEQISIFVRSEHDEYNLYDDILKHMDRKIQIFFVFAYGSATKAATSTIADMNNDGQITERNGYIFWSKPGKDRVGMIKYTWEFQLCG